ncbi:MAG: ABC transporter ATP-binding protein [Roseiflexaceae bacterium]|nr:ABC transporter ATP-binding protein [Roseiflexaceae bacterium]
MNVIETNQLQKVYGGKIAVADLTLQVPKGEVFGFLGPNGAGKSTSVKMLLGLVKPTSGQAQLLGRNPGDPQAMARVGFLPEHFRFHEWLQANEFLDLHGRLFGMDAATRRARIPELLEMVGLSEQAKRPLSGFSKGMLQRIGLAQALLNDPELVFLDEPTSALDPFGRMLVRGIIHELKARGTSVFLNSHLLGEVEATCDRVAFIRQGRVLQTLLLRDLQPDHVRVALTVDSVTPELLAALARVPGLAGLDDARQAAETAGNVAVASTTTIEFMLAEEDAIPLVAEAALASGARLYGLTPRRVSLEQLFLDVVGTEDSGQ